MPDRSRMPGRGRRPRAEHHPPRGDRVHAPVRLHLHADDAPVAKQHAAHERVRADRAAPRRARTAGDEVAARGAHAHAVHEVHRVRPDARGRRIVRVGALLEALRRARLDERALPRGVLVRRMTPDGNRPVLRVPGAPDVEVVLEPFERRQNFLPCPVAQAHRRPLVVVVRLPAQSDARVDGRRAADDATSRKPEEKPRLRPRPMHLPPVVTAHRVARSVAQVVGQSLSGQGSQGPPRAAVHRDGHLPSRASRGRLPMTLRRRRSCPRARREMLVCRAMSTRRSTRATVPQAAKFRSPADRRGGHHAAGRVGRAARRRAAFGPDADGPAARARSRLGRAPVLGRVRRVP